MSEAEDMEDSKAVPQCGTVAAISRHKRLGEPLDPACREEQRNYHKQRRTEGPKRKSSRTITARETMAIREQARRILGDRHPNELISIMKDLRAQRAGATKGQGDDDGEG